MKISVITVCFNAKDTIEETFISLKKQTCKDFEHIVIDGASTDGTTEIINKYKDNITHFISEPDNGVYDAMNKGIKRAGGDFVFFLNANDILYDENVLKNVAEILDKYPDTKFLFGNVNNISEDKKTSTIQSYNKVKNIFYFINNNICHQSIFYHRSLFDEFGYYSNEFKIYADWEFNIKCLVENKVQAIHLPITISNFQFGGMCTNINNRKLYKMENDLLVKKYFPQFRFLIRTDKFLMKNFKTLYQGFRKSSFFNKITDAFVSQKKFGLNIQIVEINY